ncbi:MAG: DUF378 domain-containing protein [Lachnospiraceae bacterium]|nr:DUF378 domain-containing protein [Lachnospiraceae bacterium]
MYIKKKHGYTIPYRRWNTLKYNWLDIISLTLVIVGALNWGLIGLFNFDLVAALFGKMSMLSRIVYSLVGIAGLYALSFYMKFSDK